VIHEQPSRPLPPLDRVPYLVMDYDQLRLLGLDEGEAFVLSLLDGRSSVRTIVQMTGWPRSQALRAIAHLVALGALELRVSDEPIRGRRW
jgi:hypothetical protein